MTASSGSTPRIVTRGETSQFNVGFFADEAKTIPLVPVSPQYPTYTIYDLTGTPIQSGTGTSTSPGNFKLDFQVPKDAKLSYFHQRPQTYNDKKQGMDLTANDGRYRIEWTIVTAENFQVQFVEEFDVQDVAITQSESRELKYLVFSGKSFRVFFRTTAVPYKANMKLIQRGADCSVEEATYDSTLSPQPPNALKYAKDGDSYVLYFDIPEGTTQLNTCYMLLWEIQDSAFEPPTIEYQVVTAIGISLLPLMTSLRMLIDRFQKRIGRIQAYEDSDLLEYLSQGLRMVNVSYPTTEFRMAEIPDSFQALVLLAAGWWGLQAQKILQTELGFSFSGQSVTLTVDQQAGLDAAAASMMDMFNKDIAAAKMAYVRRARGVGTVAGRAYSYRQQYQYVYRISSLGSDALLGTLTKIGLL